MSKNYAVARVQQYAKASIGKSERHIERKNQNYENMNVDLSQTPRNVHFQSCGDLTYNATLDKMIEDGAVSLRGLKPDAKLFDEMIFDVNTAYFEEHGGYDYACRFYEEVFRFAQKEYGPENILSAVMHADELNSALTEKLGYPVYHYHLHVVALPVVEKEVRYSKRCKDPELVGKVKSVIHQISHSKKWASQKVTDEDGKSHIIKSYSLLQDRFFEHMRDAGFEDFERGERGSTAQHLSVTEFKVKKETERLENLEKQTEQARERLDFLTPAVKGAEEFVQNNVSTLEDLLPEAGPLERAKSYREEKALPLIRKLKEKMLSLYRIILNLRDRLDRLQRQFHNAERDRDYYRAQFEKEQEKCGELQKDVEDYGRVKQVLGPEQVDAALAAAREREARLEAERKAAELERRRARRRHDRNAR